MAQSNQLQAQQRNQQITRNRLPSLAEVLRRSEQIRPFSPTSQLELTVGRECRHRYEATSRFVLLLLVLAEGGK